MKKILKTFYALSDESRLELFLQILRKSKLALMSDDQNMYKGNCLSYLQHEMNLSQPTMSHHLKVLDEAGLIIKIKKGKWTHLFPNLDTLDSLTTVLNENKTAFTQKPTLLNLCRLAKDFDFNSFTELISLVENHGFKRKYLSANKVNFISFLESKQDTTYILTVDLKKNSLEIKTFERIDESGQDKNLVRVITRYLKTNSFEP